MSIARTWPEIVSSSRMDASVARIPSASLHLKSLRASYAGFWVTASKSWRRLRGENQLPKVMAGVTFRDGTEVIAQPDHRAA